MLIITPYLQTRRYSLGAFQKRLQGYVGSVVGGEVDAWLRSSGLSPRTRNNIRRAIRSLFEFSKGKRYLQQLCKRHPDLYAALKQFYRQDPAPWAFDSKDGNESGQPTPVGDQAVVRRP
jgi:hypothetical protein